MKTLSALANIALVDVALDLGFNCVGVEQWYDLDLGHQRIAFTFGDEREMRLRVPFSQEWARAYDESYPCVREQKTIEVPHTTALGLKQDLRDFLVVGLLELAA